MKTVVVDGWIVAVMAVPVSASVVVKPVVFVVDNAFDVAVGISTVAAVALSVGTATVFGIPVKVTAAFVDFAVVAVSVAKSFGVVASSAAVFGVSIVIEFIVAVGVDVVCAFDIIVGVSVETAALSVPTPSVVFSTAGFEGIAVVIAVAASELRTSNDFDVMSVDTEVDN
nr:unnamed protein product [Haemonchus contortus]